MKENTPTVGVVGLGSMGGGMARSLVRAGLATHGFDVDAARVAEFCAEGGHGGSFAEVGPMLDIIATVVVNADQTETVLFGENGLASVLRKGTVILSCATVSPDFARAMEARCASLGLLYLDAPISGGSVKAGQGALSIMASGSDAAFEAAQPALDAMAGNVFRLGGAAGAGSALKVINQMLAGVHIAAAAEAITFGISQGVDPQTTVDVISKCAGSSWMFENRGPHIADGDYTPHSAVDIFVKDLGIVSDVARAAKFSAPLSAVALQQFVAAAGAGYGREDDAAVAKIYARNAGLELPKSED
ncbi:MAG: NAD-binding protein [Alphaproteobacteria bacterium]|nr:NAD-binding protein [Alphaproteobacteria bacterium]